MDHATTICAISDIHGDISYLDRIGETLEESDIVLIAGDLTNTGKRVCALDILYEIEQYNTNIIAVHGNWDRNEVLDLLEEKKYSLHARGKIVNNIGFFGTGGSVITPMKTATEFSEEELYEYLQTGYDMIKSAPVRIMVSHNPPLGARDRTFFRLRAGSSSVRDFIIENRCELCICGHIHEACGSDFVVETPVINCGSFRQGCYSLISVGEEITFEQHRLSKKRKKKKKQEDHDREKND
jgi:hypothetical protein